MVAAGFVMAMTAPLELVYARRLGAGPGAIALYIALPGIGMLCVDVLCSRLVPRLDARAILSVGIVVFGAGDAAIGLSSSVPLLMPARVLQGLGGGLLLGSALQAALRVNAERERSLGSFNGAFLLGTAVGAPAGGLIATVIPGLGGYRLSFAVCTTLSVLVALAVQVLLPPLPADGGGPQARIGFPRLSGPPGYGAAMTLGMLGDLLRGSLVYSTIPLAGLLRHYSTVTIGLAVGLLAASEILALRGLVGFIIRFGLARCLVVSLEIGVVAALGFAFVPGQLAYLFCATVFGVVIAAASLAPALLLVSLHDADPSQGIASFRMASGFGQVVGSTGAGTAVAGIGSSSVFCAVATILAGGAVLAHRLRRLLNAPPAA
jgi:predicted MFS family arabinose efflux permease